MQPRAIHQLLLSCQPGDGIGNGAFYIRRLLRARGLTSEIYAVTIHPELRSEVWPLTAYEPHPEQLLLIHHGSGNGYESWLRRLPDRKILIYHNITPVRFFAADDPVRADLQLGREQLGAWTDWLDGAIGDSPQNTQELWEAGHDPERTETIPLLVDRDRLRAQEPATEIVRYHEDRRTLLFVGRQVPHKGCLALIEAFHHLQGLTDQPTELILVGDSEPDYEARLEQAISDRGLRNRVHRPGKVDEVQLASYFAAADAYVSLSEHEGFGMPLVEAMAFDVPVIAYSAPESAVADTMGEGGLVLAESDPRQLAGTLAVLFEEPGLRSHLVGAQRRRLADFEPDKIQQDLGHFLARLGIEMPPPESEVGSSPPILRHRLEGPFDSSYSLALLNREMARALAQRYPGKVGLFATEGEGDLRPDPAFLARNPEIRALWERGQRWLPTEYVTRLLFPPRVTGMSGRCRVLSAFGWEESGFPRERVRQFNAYLDLITTMSSYVAKVLRDNGVRTPIAKVGVGTDHMSQAPPNPVPLPDLGPGLRFLHISSAFPRKGVDVLLRAYAQVFRADDDVVLVIKTFPNPHNDIEERLAKLAREDPNHGRIVLINQDLSDAAMRALYQHCHVLVAPSRGEGYGLPLAEAMLERLPVITTAYGGQQDFATEDTAWLLDYRFEYAATHLDLWDSLWAEPSESDLQAQLQAFYCHYRLGSLDEWIRPRVDRAETQIRANHTWQAVAERFETATAGLECHSPLSPQPRLGWVSTWNVCCGLATYSEQLLGHGALSPVVFAPRDEAIRGSEEGVVRCWRMGGADPLDELLQAIQEQGLDQLVIQFNFSFFGLEALRRLIRRLHDQGIQVILFLHSTADVTVGGEHKSLRQLQPELNEVTRVFVHGVADLNRLKDLGIVANAALFPHGVAWNKLPAPIPEKPKEDLAGQTVIASHGFLLPHKGIPALIDAFARLVPERPELRLLLLNAEYPVPESREERFRCEDRIADQGLEGRVHFVTDFLSESEILAWLQLADLVVYPYRYTQESASGAVRWGLSARRPVLCAPLPIFEDVAEVVRFLSDTEPDAIAQDIVQLLDDSREREAQWQRQEEWLAAHDWQVLAERLAGCLAGLYRDRSRPEDLGTDTGKLGQGPERDHQGNGAHYHDRTA